MDWKRFFDNLGMNGTRWQWRIMRWQQRWVDFKDSCGHKKDQVAMRHKFCDACGALLAGDERICNRCAARVSSLRTQRMRRFFALNLPAHCMASTVILAIIGLLGVIQFAPALHHRLTAIGAYHFDYIAHGQLWRLIDYLFLHSTSSWMHLIFNAMALSQVGPMVEKEIGSARFFVIYILSGITAALGHTLVSGAGLVGASGALFGMIGFGAAYAHFIGSRTQRNFFIQWAAYGLIFGILVPHVANAAHVGGLVMGLLMGYLISREQRMGNRFARQWKSMATVLWLFTLFSLAAIPVIYRITFGGS